MFTLKLPFNCKKKIHGCSNSELSFKLVSDKRFAQSLKNTYEGVYFGKNNRSSHYRCSLRKGVLKIRKIHRKTPVPESLF